MEEVIRGRGRPKGSSSFVHVSLSQLNARMPQDAIVPVSTVWLKQMGFSIEAPTLAEMPVSQAQEIKKETAKITFAIVEEEEEEETAETTY